MIKVAECLNCHTETGIVLERNLISDQDETLEIQEWKCPVCGKEWRSEEHFQRVRTKTKVHYYREGEKEPIPTFIGNY